MFSLKQYIFFRILLTKMTAIVFNLNEVIEVWKCARTYF